MSSVAPPSNYDLRFEVLGIPVRVHPFFWMFSALLGMTGARNDLRLVALWVACVFVSILVHEFGHALMGKWFGGSPSILLYSLGGLCYSGTERTPGQRLAVVLAGPAAGFLLFLATLLVYSLLYHITPAEHLALVRPFVGLTPNAQAFLGGLSKLPSGLGRDVSLIRETYVQMVQINLYWTLINLLPIWPLDGGQAAQVVMTQANPRNGLRWSHGVSFVTAGLIAIFLGVQSQDLFITLFMGYFAYINYEQLQRLHEASRFSKDDDDWWRR
ncbi:metalloprotease [Paludisphaera rhizosphaerae]|uniref:metalloprotease n=1 Tax=Paludisphaera rhizosphaerae TaxID=2711216 RepID=UPI0013EA6544|nr:site-2 protease family protein [Paludisphaera rhizosphaerae]